MEEIWKPIVGLEDYEISNFGNVRKCGHYLKIQKRGNGYLFYHLSVNGEHFNKSAHRLVAEAFIDNPNNKPCVNHIDGDKTNNIVSNLEWCTYSENQKWNYKIGLSIPLNTDKQKEQWCDCINCCKKYMKSIQKNIVCNETGEIFENSRECSEKMHIDRRDIMRNIKGTPVINRYKDKLGNIKEYKTYVSNVKGYTFKYA